MIPLIDPVGTLKPLTYPHSLSIVIPVFNEEENLSLLVQSIRRRQC